MGRKERRKRQLEDVGHICENCFSVILFYLCKIFRKGTQEFKIKLYMIIQWKLFFICHFSFLFCFIWFFFLVSSAYVLCLVLVFGFLHFLWNILQLLCIICHGFVFRILLKVALAVVVYWQIWKFVAITIFMAAWRNVYTFHINNNIYSVQLLLQLQLSWVHLIFKFYTFPFRTYAKIIVWQKELHIS